MLIFLCELGIGIAGYIKHGQLEEILETGFNKTMADYAKNEEAWDLVQKEVELKFSFFHSTVWSDQNFYSIFIQMHCCGIKGPDDYQQVFHDLTLPNSCCTKFAPNSNVCTQENAVKNGCMPILVQFFQSKSLLLAGVGIGIALVQVREHLSLNLIGVCSDAQMKNNF